MWRPMLAPIARWIGPHEAGGIITRATKLPTSLLPLVWHRSPACSAMRDGPSSGSWKQSKVDDVADYSLITPYLVPPQIRGWKAVNIGDGFILHAITDLLRPHTCRFTFSSREPLSDAAIEQVNSTRMVVLGGDNKLTQKLSISRERV